jgi:uroporphyrin-III C-methyltransferase/precorrin-2 dehydrogenase/sirohydrochlorin ferrochelatase
MARLLFPAFLDLVNRRVLVVGAGQVALAKILRLLDAGADVVVVAPDIDREIECLAGGPASPERADASRRERADASRRVEVRRRPFHPDDLDGIWYAVSAAPPSVNAHVVSEATKRGIFVNAVDDPPNATAFAGSVFTRGPVTVALSTGGEAPALARVLREALEKLVGRNVEDWTALAASLRQDWKRDGVPMERRRDALLTALTQLHAEVQRASSAPPAAGATEAVRTGFVSLVGGGPGDPELLTRKAARRLAEADLVLYDALVSPAIVSLATHAQQIMVGRRRGSETMGQEAINRTLIRAARRGKRVVRLKGGDPFVFGRGGDEALALKAAGVPFEVVPGVSSAFAAPASAGIPVTHRGVSGTVLVTTGHDVERFAHSVGSIDPDATTLVVMMGTAHRREIAEALTDAGWRESMPAAIVRDATLPGQTVWTGTVGTLIDAPDDSAPGTIIIGEVVQLREHIGQQAPGLAPAKSGALDQGRASLPDLRARALARASMGVEVAACRTH